MSKYYQQVATVDKDVRILEDKVKNHDTFYELLSKHFIVDHQTTSFNAVCEVLTKVLKNDELISLIDYMTDRQEDLSKKKMNVSSMKLKDQMLAAKKYLQRPVGFVKIPRKPGKGDKLPSVNEIKALIAQYATTATKSPSKRSETSSARAALKTIKEGKARVRNEYKSRKSGSASLYSDPKSRHSS